MDRKTSQTGWVFEHQTYIIRRDLGKEVFFPTDKLTINEGYRSLCSIPLIVRGNSIGVVSVLSNPLAIFYLVFRHEVSDRRATLLANLLEDYSLPVLRVPHYGSERINDRIRRG